MDDSLFFCKAQKEECQTILWILKEYEVVSGQLINFDKSSIQFGHRIEESAIHELRDILGIQNLGGMGSYLGLPENLGDPRYKFLALCRTGLIIELMVGPSNFSQMEEMK